MRLWSIHPRYFDAQAVTSSWREGLIAQRVLAEPGSSLRSHPQLQRFLEAEEPLEAVAAYLGGVADEAGARGMDLDRSRIIAAGSLRGPLVVTDGQLDYEWGNLRRHLLERSPDVAARWARVWRPQPHPVFVVVGGGVAAWELA
ncbi:hypothetical protein ASF83_16360 [Plantibacter sp. Leaf171]|nr:hypothetical protein ASE44_16375 [Plantibacter sp. Leaf1]KQR57720.1 hypothetical protein ASF83_16360 [Plantibacter sp. Leaf171]